MSDEEKKPESASIPAWQRTEAASTDEKPSSITAAATTTTTTTTEEATPAPAAQASETATADARAASSPRTESAQASSDPEPEKNSSNNEKALVKVEPTIGSDTEEEEREEENDRLTVARRFLDDEDVRSAPRSRKVAFLQSKGVSTTDIETLIGPEKTITQNQEPTTDRAPIVTYPEFLTTPKTGSEPLVTPGLVSATLQASAVLATTVYGLSRFVLSPMLENLTEARQELVATASDKLDALVGKLESTVSHVPAATPKRAHPAAAAEQEEEGYSDAEDPSEMFHRDVGTQVTSPILAPGDGREPEEPDYVRQAARLRDLNARLKDLNGDILSQSEDIGDVKALVDVLRDDLDGLTYRSMGGDYLGGLNGGFSGRKEPNDEIRKARDNIRRIKGVLLSSRSFPASAR
ncbi:hypothetical protein N3K66_006458 [Trichothecium roseum]|uniref:Uncharacterized protein n=1 Tax=Trichothecium roseum TaxID=47278 RepID=A0ACC0UXZ4_9HYPO|nr:hypothetical protein N3K66_006458 [Trichothecium roseum]